MHLILCLVALACQRSAANPSKDEEKYDGGGQQLKYRPKDAHRSKRSSENYAALGAVYPVQVDLTDWIVRSEKRMENLTALVESHFRGIATLIEGFQKKFEDLDERIRSTEKKSQRNFDKIENRLQSMEQSYEELKENCSTSSPSPERPSVGTSTEKNKDQSRAPFAPTSPSTFSTSITPSSWTCQVPSAKCQVPWTCQVDPCTVTSPWILIMSRDNSDKKSFKEATLRDYRNGFGSVPSSAFWRGLQEVHELTSEGRWTLKIQFRYGSSPYKAPERSRTYGEAEWGNFSVGPAEEDYPLRLGEQISATNFAGDPFTTEDYYGNIMDQRGAVFSAPDEDNDFADCAISREGGWWFLHGQCYPNICLTCNDDSSGVLILDFDDYDQKALTEATESFMWIKKET